MQDYLPVSKLEIQTEEMFKNRAKGNFSTEINAFVAAVKAEMPHLSFRSTGTYASEVAVYREGDAFAWGWITYGDYSPSKEVRTRYIVCSQTIENKKYKEGSDPRKMAMTDSLEKAVKLVKKHLRPVPLEVAAKQSCPVLNEQFMDANRLVTKNLTNNVLTILGYSGTKFLPGALENAFTSLHMQGIVIGDYHFDNVVRDYFTAKADYELATQFSGKVFFVHPHMRLGTPVYEVCPVAWANTVNRTLPFFSVDKDPFFSVADDSWLAASDEDLETIKGKVAVLFMMQKNEYVHGVGMKVDDSRYFVVV